jgi:hypothetical protein
MRLAGQRLIELLVGAAEGIALRDLPQKHGYPFNLAKLARMAKQGLREEGVPLTPASFRQAADTQAARWSSMSHDWAGIGEPDYRAFMDGRVGDFLRSAQEVREEAAAAEAALEADMLLRRQARASAPLVDPYEDTPF